MVRPGPTAIRTVAPAASPVSVAEVKARIREDFSDQDTVIADLIATATERLDGVDGDLQRALVTQTWRSHHDGFPPDGVLLLPLAPLQSVSSVVYLAADGSETTLATDAYVVEPRAATPFLERAVGTSWPDTVDRPGAVRVTAVYGYGEPSDVPARLKTAICLMVADLYEHRETTARGPVSTAPMSLTVDALIGPYKRHVFG